MNKTPKYITPGLSPILRKYRTIEGRDYMPDFTTITQEANDKVLLLVSITESKAFENTIIKSILKNKNICIHPSYLSFYYSFEYGNPTGNDEVIQDLNEAYLPYDYKNWYIKHRNFLNKFSDIKTSDHIVKYINEFFKTTFIDCDKRFIFYKVGSQAFHYFKKINNFRIVGHASFCIYDNYTQKGYFFDPAQTELEKHEGLGKIDEINRRKITKYKVLNSIRATNPFLKIKDVEIVDVTAPQSITEDANCLFWSLLLCDIIVKNLKEDEPFRPKLMIQSLLKKYNTKEKLLRVIGRYIGYVYEQAKAEANRKTGKWSIRRTGEIPRSFYKNILKNVYVRKTQS